LVGLPISILGLGVAAYLTYEHYTASKTLSCPATGGIVNCFKVTTSSYSKIHGVPVSVLGLIFFAVMIVLQSPPAWATTNRVLRIGRLAWAAVGLATACWLIYAELFKLDAICLWCTSVHVMSLILFATTAFGTAATATPVDFEDEEEWAEDDTAEDDTADEETADGDTPAEGTAGDTAGGDTAEEEARA
jgi:uncharacterized membrane protein